MVSMSAGVVLFLVLVGVFWVICWRYFLKGAEAKNSVLISSVILFLCGLIAGGYIEGGEVLPIHSKGSAQFIVGHYYETVVRVPMSTPKKDAKGGAFVIKDGGSEKILLVYVEQDELPPRFTVNDKGGIIPLPASTILSGN